MLKNKIRVLKNKTRVRIRDDLWGAVNYGNQIATADMTGFRGQWMTIKEWDDNNLGYILEEDPDEYLWTEEMFSEVEEEKTYDVHTAAFTLGYSVGRIGYLIGVLQAKLMSPDVIETLREIIELASDAKTAIEQIEEDKNGNS